MYAHKIQANLISDAWLCVDLDTSADEEDVTAQSVITSQTTHMVRGTWLSRSGGFPTYGLPQPLLSHLRAALGCDIDESTTETDVRMMLCFHGWGVWHVMWLIFILTPSFNCTFRKRKTTRWCWKQSCPYLIPCLKNCLRQMILTGAASCSNSIWSDAIHQHHLPAIVHLIPCRESASWDVKLALDYKDLQRRIISSIVISCTSALEKF